MFELPEVMVLARQMNELVKGKQIADASLGNSPHKFAWYNRSDSEFRSLVTGKTIGHSKALGRWMVTDIGTEHRMVLGETGGKLLLNKPNTALPPKYHFLLRFSDESFLTLQIQMWGAIELYEAGAELNRDYIRGMAVTPADPGFTMDYFHDLVEQERSKGKRSVKSLLTQEQTIPGLGNSCAQDIMFASRLHPKRDLADLSPRDIDTLYTAIRQIVEDIYTAGGRNDEVDLLGNRGGYIRIMDASTAGKPCPHCGTIIQKMQYLGGACYFCPACQR